MNIMGFFYNATHFIVGIKSIILKKKTSDY